MPQWSTIPKGDYQSSKPSLFCDLIAQNYNKVLRRDELEMFMKKESEEACLK